MRRSSLKLALLVGAPLALMTTHASAQEPSTPAAPASPDATTPSPNATSSTPPAAASAPSAEGTVSVHIDSPKPVSLEHRASGGVAWEHVCEAPCDQRVSVGDQYRIVGMDLNESNPFMLDSTKGDTVTLHIGPGEIKKQRIGTYVLIGGGVLFLGGLIGGLAASHPSETFTADGTTNNSNWSAIIVGTSLALVGLGGAIFGGAWVVNNAHTRVGGDVQAAPPARGDNAPSHLTGLRTDLPTNPAAIVPLFHTTF
jgi:hypothetical protein